MNRQFEQITAIYTRVDSGEYDKKTAISQQKAALTKYAREHGLTNIRIYIEKFLPRHHVGLYSIKEQITPEHPVSLALPIALLFGGGR